MRALLFCWALYRSPAAACSFMVSSYNLTARHSPTQLALANWWQRRRGPDATTVGNLGEWSLLHNLLSMTGAVTPQPFVSEHVAAVFNGEIYNYRDLSQQLTGRPDAFASDGHALLPAYERWGERFVERLQGEFALVLVDLQTRRVLLSTDAFATKPLWYAAWRDPAGEPRFLASSYESALKHLGAPDGARRMAAPNEALVFARRGGAFERVSAFTLVRWDLNQHKNHTRDWAAAFREAVAVRTRGIKHRAFIGSRSTWSSGASRLLSRRGCESNDFLTAYFLRSCTSG